MWPSQHVDFERTRIRPHRKGSARVKAAARRTHPQHPRHRDSLHRSALSPQPPALAALGRRLRAERGSMKAVAMSRMLRVGPPGRGFHTGGTFPMRANPGPFEVDVLGRPHGFTRVHVVDSSVFPSLPATTITLSVMANAHRILSLIHISEPTRLGMIS